MEQSKNIDRKEYKKEYTWFDNYKAFWITEFGFDDRYWEHVYKKHVAIALGNTKEEAEQNADTLLKFYNGTTK